MRKVGGRWANEVFKKIDIDHHGKPVYQFGGSGFVPSPEGDLELASALLEAGADPNRCTGFGCTALHLVMKGLGEREAVAHAVLLLKHGADPLRLEFEGQQPPFARASVDAASARVA